MKDHDKTTRQAILLKVVVSFINIYFMLSSTFLSTIILLAHNVDKPLIVLFADIYILSNWSIFVENFLIN
jgi:hypothetical protein